MLIVCPNCSTSYEVTTETIGDSGRTVRCTRCRKEWFETAPSMEAVGVAAPAESAPTPSTVATVVDRPVPAAASDDQIDWDMPVPDQPAPAAADQNPADEDIAASWEVPQTPSPPLAPDSGVIEAVPSPSVKIETAAAARTRRPRWRRLDRIELPLAPTLIAVQLTMICAGLLWRNEIVRLMPQTASFFRAIGLDVNVRGLVFADVRTSRDAHDGVTVLIVEGAIVNTTRAIISVPRLRFALRNAASVELSSWTAPPDKGILAPGDTLSFRSRLVSPPAGGSDILVRFLNRQDFATGAR